MTSIPITAAKALANEYRASGVLILAFGDNGYQITSYGATRAKCDALKVMVDEMAKAFDEEGLPLVSRIPGELR